MHIFSWVQRRRGYWDIRTTCRAACYATQNQISRRLVLSKDIFAFSCNVVFKCFLLFSSPGGQCGIDRGTCYAPALPATNFLRQHFVHVKCVAPKDVFVTLLAGKSANRQFAEKKLLNVCGAAFLLILRAAVFNLELAWDMVYLMNNYWKDRTACFVMIRVGCIFQQYRQQIPCFWGRVLKDVSAALTA